MPDKPVFEVAVYMSVSGVDSPESAAARMDAWFRSADSADVAYDITGPDGANYRVVRSANDGWKIREY